VCSSDLLDKLVQFVQDRGLARSVVDATGKAVTATAGAVGRATPEAALRGGMTYQFTTEPSTRGGVKQRQGLFSQ
jgi:hypothetical protein